MMTNGALEAWVEKLGCTIFLGETNLLINCTPTAPFLHM